MVPMAVLADSAPGSAEQWNSRDSVRTTWLGLVGDGPSGRRNYDKPADEHLPAGQVGTNVDKYGKVSSQGFPWRPIVAILIFNCMRHPLSACGLVGQFCKAKPVHFWRAAKSWRATACTASPTLKLGVWYGTRRVPS